MRIANWMPCAALLLAGGGEAVGTELLSGHWSGHAGDFTTRWVLAQSGTAVTGRGDYDLAGEPGSWSIRDGELSGSIDGRHVSILLDGADASGTRVTAVHELELREDGCLEGTFKPSTTGRAVPMRLCRMEDCGLI